MNSDIGQPVGVIIRVSVCPLHQINNPLGNMVRSDIVLQVTVGDEESLPILPDSVTLGLVFIGLEGLDRAQHIIQQVMTHVFGQGLNDYFCRHLTGLLRLGQETRFCEKTLERGWAKTGNTLGRPIMHVSHSFSCQRLVSPGKRS